MSSIAFEITTDIGITCTEFLDVLLLNTYCPYRKPNFKTNYINNNSNYPKNIPKMIENRLCKISKDEKVFSSIKEFYQNALNKIIINIIKPTDNLITQTLRETEKEIAFITTPPFVNPCRQKLANIS